MHAPDACIAHNANGHASCQTGQTTSQASSQVREAIVQDVGLRACMCERDGRI